MFSIILSDALWPRAAAGGRDAVNGPRQGGAAGAAALAAPGGEGWGGGGGGRLAVE
ncbi:MAG: hypothetical protein IPG33_12690 [Betaproteobacteria bacterium]|nr:hypothetical protein [Betaproteobacteria bacterium]